MSLKLRPTAVRKFYECQFRFHREYIEGKQPAPNEPMRFGTAMHSFSEIVAKAYYKGQTVELDKLVMQCIEESGLSPAAHLDRAKHVGKNLGNKIRGFDFKTCIGVEERMETIIEGIEWHGTADIMFLNGAVLDIFDYKTSLAVPDQATLAKDPQTLYYVYCAFLQYEQVQEIRMTYYYPEWNRTQDPIIIPRGMLPEIKEKLEMATRQIKTAVETSQWAKLPNPYCGSCWDALQCQEERGDVTTTEKMERYIVLNSICTQYREELKKTCREVPQFYSGQTILAGWIATESEEITNQKEVAEWLIKNHPERLADLICFHSDGLAIISKLENCPAVKQTIFTPKFEISKNSPEKFLNFHKQKELAETARNTPLVPTDWQHKDGSPVMLKMLAEGWVAWCGDRKVKSCEPQLTPGRALEHFEGLYATGKTYLRLVRSSLRKPPAMKT